MAIIDDMGKRAAILAFALFLALCKPILLPAQNKAPLVTTRILLVFDCSMSMIGKWESGTKMDVTKKLLAQAIDSLSKIPNVEVALRMYGHQSSVNPVRNCKDTKLEVPFSPGNIPAILNKIRGAQPKGTTPIAYSLEQCGNDFPPKPNTRNIIILITDGVEECDGDPCAVSAALQSQGIVLRPFVLGVGLDVNFKKSFECVGKFFDASNEATFKNALGVIISQAMNATTTQVNLLDASGKPTETDISYTLYDQGTGQMMHHFEHTINNAGYPDTIRIDPLPTYRMVVHSLPAVEKKDISLTPGKHNIISASVPQGYLVLKTNNAREYKNLPYILRKNGEMNTLNVCYADRTERLLTGKYDLEILSMPRLMIPDVEISQSKTTSIQIPQPGIANILFNGPGYGSLLIEEKNEVKWLYNFAENTQRETLTLLPGKYRVIFRPKAAKETIYTVDKEFILEPGGTVTIKTF